ncbi:WD40 repeat domain-containing protein [Solidesulfovibrio sp.]|uniref:WD40 repeat domain-containing protein n=1 Tax=Solidesulfovibrio sp. TaxID=2910990 RepID=UPI002B200226|nr:WD40 repeat domain-containing protein [Solidesulfovibrio sp.]MEA4856980.1 WD40 repeat domain-containing protein [Solidesulfovibrio sp.]
MNFSPDEAVPGLRTAAIGAYVSGCAVSPDGDTAAYALGDGRLVRLDTASGEAASVDAHDGGVLSLAAAPQGFVTGGDDGRVALTRPDGRTTELARFPGQWIEHVGASRDGSVLAAARGKAVVLFRGEDLAPQLLPELPAVIGGLAVRRDGRAVAASHYDGVTVYAPPRPDARGNTFDGPGANLTLVFSDDGAKMACATQDKSVRVYDLAQSAGYLLEGYPAKVRCLCFSPDGNMLWTGGEQAFVGWPVDAATDPARREAVVFGAFEHGLLGAVAAHPVLPLVAGGFDGGVIFLGSPERRGAAPLLVLENRRVTSLAWSTDGRRLVGGGDGGAAFFMDMAG